MSLILSPFSLCFLLMDKVINHDFFFARQTYSGFFQKPPNQKQTQPDRVTCENKFWWQGIQTIANCTHEDFMSLPKAHLSEQVVRINLYCVTDKASKQTNKKQATKMNIFTIQYGKRRGLGGKRGNNRRDNIWVDRKTLKKTFYSLLL